MKKILILVFCALCSAGFSAAQAGLKKAAAGNPAFHYTGRFEQANPEEIRFDWPGFTIQCRFTGSRAGIHFQGGERNYFNLYLDGEPVGVLHAPRDTVWWTERLKTKGPHHLKLVKRTEGDMGQAWFRGIVLEKGAEILPIEQIPARRIEFIGNSITCGYGTEGASRDERFKPETENNEKTYGAVLARAFNAEAHFIAHSGLGVVRNYGDEKKISTRIVPMPGRYGRSLDTDTLPAWDHSRWKPQAVVINLGTNDFSTLPYPDKAVFQRRYEELIQQVRKIHGEIPVFCVVGPMIHEPCFSYVKEMVDGFRTLYNDSNVFFVGLPNSLLNESSDLGSDWHPSYQGQKKIAGQLLLPIATILDWDYSGTEIFE